MKLFRLLFVISLPLGFLLPASLTSASPFAYDHYAILVKDLNRSVAFYSNILQLKETYDATEKANIRWFALAGDQQLHIIQAEDTAAIVKHKGVHLALTTPNFDAFVKRLKENNIAFESWPGDAGQSNVRPDGVRQVYLQDPDGYWLEINDASTHWPSPKTPK